MTRLFLQMTLVSKHNKHAFVSGERSFRDCSGNILDRLQLCVNMKQKNSSISTLICVMTYIKVMMHTVQRLFRYLYYPFFAVHDIGFQNSNRSWAYINTFSLFRIQYNVQVYKLFNFLYYICIRKPFFVYNICIRNIYILVI